MISINNLTIKTNNGRLLVQDLCFNLNYGDKLAIIGEEGNGKSTILKAIYNKTLISDYCEVSGIINTTGEVVGYLDQKLSNKWKDETVVDYLADDDTGGKDYSIFEKLNMIDKYQELEAIKYIIDNNPQIGELSGGEQVKLQLTKLLLKEPTLLLLDEPTNDIDIETLNWLQMVITKFNKAVIFISHDEIMLKNCANQILHIEQLIKKSTPKHTISKVGYEQYVNERSLTITKQTQQAEYERREQAKQQTTLRQIKQKVENALHKAIREPFLGSVLAQKMKNVLAQESRFEKQQITEIPEVEESIKIVLNKTKTIPKQKKLINLHLKELKLGEKVLSKNIDFQLYGPQKVAIVGKNGAGKTTLIKQILPIISCCQGVSVGYFSQNYYENLNYNNSATVELESANPNVNAKTLLGSLKFTYEEMDKKINALSEGQKAKLLLLKLLASKHNVLILDEPTRNISPLTKPVIKNILKNYNGAIITTSHDRQFIKDICDTVYLLVKEGLHKINDLDY